MYLNLKS